MMKRGLVVSVSLVCACGGEGRFALDALTPSDAAPDPRQVVATLPVTLNRNVDLLFVIDDSASMADKQSNLRANLPNFINVLNTIEGGFPDVHIGVVSTDMGTKGTNGAPGPTVGTVGQGGCANTGDDGRLQTNGAAVTGNFISDIRQSDGTRLRNYTGDLATVFGQMVQLGATGCGFEQPLHAMRRALQNTTANPGFLRPDAKLGVIILADEDDCSATDASLFAADQSVLGPLTSFRCSRFGVTCAVGGTTPDEMNAVGAKSNCASNATSTVLDDISVFRSFLLGLKADPRDVFVAGIIGNPTPVAVEDRQNPAGMVQRALAHSCSYAAPSGTEVADPGVRLKHFFDQFANRSRFESICQPDLSGPLQQIADLARQTVGNPCITASLAMPLDCILEDEAAPNGTKTTIPQCGSPETAPCWKLETDPVRCPTAENLKLVVVRSEAPPPATVSTLRCRLDA